MLASNPVEELHTLLDIVLSVGLFHSPHFHVNVIHFHVFPVFLLVIRCEINKILFHLEVNERHYEVPPIQYLFLKFYHNIEQLVFNFLQALPLIGRCLCRNF